MADERRGTGSMRGRFLLGESYGEPGPGLGTLYEAWRAGSARPALVFALGLGMGRMTSSPLPPVETYASMMDSDTIVLTDVPPLPDGGTPDGGLLAYPLPAKPFNNQTAGPCKRREAEFNGGCWQEIAQRPPCDKDILEHQGKCYIPVGKRPRLPQAVEPMGK